MSEKPLPIFYDARTIRPGMTGVGRYTYNLLAALARRPSLRMRAMVLPEVFPLLKQHGRLENVELIAAPVSHEAHPANEWWLWRGARKIVRPDEVYHGPAFVIPIGKQPFARVVTIHDFFVITDPTLYPWRFSKWLSYMIGNNLKTAEHTILPTEVLGPFLMKIAPSPDIPWSAIHEAPDETPAEFDGGAQLELLEPHLQAKAPLIVSIGTMDRRKDAMTARKACIELAEQLKRPVRWLWIGGAGAKPDPTPEALKVEARRHGFAELGAVSSADVKAALKHAAFYVSCSRDEGFGIPLVEAMAAGCPVVASGIPVHREVCSGAAEYFPAGDAAALAAMLAGFLDNDKEGMAQRRAGSLARGKHFSWEKAAQETENAYRAAAEEFQKRGRKRIT